MWHPFRWLTGKEEDGDASEREYSRAALDNLSMPFCSGVYGDPPHVISAARKEIEKKRIWANGLSDRKWRRAYLGWVDYAATQADNSEKEYASRQRVKGLAKRSPKPGIQPQRPIPPDEPRIIADSSSWTGNG